MSAESWAGTGHPGKPWMVQRQQHIILASYHSCRFFDDTEHVPKIATETY